MTIRQQAAIAIAAGLQANPQCTLNSRDAADYAVRYAEALADRLMDGPQSAEYEREVRHESRHARTICDLKALLSEALAGLEWFDKHTPYTVKKSLLEKIRATLGKGEGACE